MRSTRCLHAIKIVSAHHILKQRPAHEHSFLETKTWASAPEWSPKNCAHGQAYKTRKQLKINRGFTLVELLLYISISSALLLTVSVFLSTLLESRVKNQTMTEVEQQGLQVMQIITQTIRNAEAINTPSPGATGVSLSLDVIPAGNDPTIFDLASGIIRISEGAGGPIALTNSRIVASDLSFQNLTRAGTPGIVRVQFTISHQNPEGRNEYEYQKTFIGSASLRQP